MKHIICISGDLASGKSAASRIITEKLGYEHFSAGNIFRQTAERMGISVLELNKLCETDHTVDRMIDSTITEIGETRDCIVFDSRMAWHFVRDGFKVYLTIDEDEAARRVFADPRGSSEKYDSVEEAKVCLRDRRKAEARRYLEKYGVDICNLDNYHCIIDTTLKTPEQVSEQIITEFEEYLKGRY